MGARRVDHPIADGETSTRGHTQTTTFVPYNPRSPADVPDGALAAVWGHWKAGRLEAEVIWTLRRQPAAAAETATRSDATPATIVAAPGGLTLPKSPPVLHGHTGSESSPKMPFKGVTGDDVTVYKIRTWQDGKALMAVSTSEEARFLLVPTTAFYRQRILRGGKEVYVTPGRREDIVPGKLVSVWGPQQNGVLGYHGCQRHDAGTNPRGPVAQAAAQRVEPQVVDVGARPAPRPTHRG